MERRKFSRKYGYYLVPRYIKTSFKEDDLLILNRPLRADKLFIIEINGRIRVTPHAPFLDKNLTVLHTKKIKTSALCEIKNQRGHRKGILVPKNKFGDFYNELINYGKIFDIGPRKDRFLTLYQIYEGLTKEGNVNLRSIRNGLSHNQRKLNNKKTLEVLNNLFDSQHIDLSNKKHELVFYQYFLDLLKETDGLIYQKLINLSCNSKVLFKGFDIVLLN